MKGMKNLKRAALILAAVSCCVFSGGMTSSAKTAVSEEKTVYKPSVLTEVTAKSRKVQVYVYENTTLYVKAGNKRIYKKSFSSEGVKRITIPAQKKGTTLSFWLVNENNGKKGAVVKTRVLAKNTSARVEAPKVTQEGQDLLIKGEMGDRVYVRQTRGSRKNKWYLAGVITSKRGLKVRVETPDADSKTIPCMVRLKGANGKFSKTVTLKLRASDFPTGVEEQNSWDKQTGDLEPQYVSEKMRIVEKEEHSLLLQDSREQLYYVSRSAVKKILTSSSLETSFAKLEKGQDVWIYYNGEVMESYPLQISEVLEMMIAK